MNILNIPARECRVEPIQKAGRARIAVSLEGIDPYQLVRQLSDAEVRELAEAIRGDRERVWLAVGELQCQ